MSLLLAPSGCPCQLGYFILYSLVQKFGSKESDMQPEQEIIFQLDTSYMLLGSGAALHQQYHWYSGNLLG
jgi:hypothetical protein